MDNIGADIEDDNDEDFEAELAALAAGNDTSYKSRRNGKLQLELYIIEICIYETRNCFVVLYIYT